MAPKKKPSDVLAGAKARAKSKGKAKAAPKAKIAASSSEPAEQEAAPPLEPEPKPVHEPVEGKCKVRYNHYNQDFKILDGRLMYAEVDEEYCFSIAFKGNYTVKVEYPDGSVSAPITPAEKAETDPPYEGLCFEGLTPDAQHKFVVEEDPALSDAPRTVYTASGGSTLIKRDTGGEMDEDSASCSCVFGNPCQSAYSCKDWNNRYEVAKKNGWKGFS
eukprot:TRINITY_DN20427_c0_g1_i2.p1 TRINITY_DN20427_c0_g1~~TRINITY_DN20427_c0_g1_i2.p1  ORF type:complete len:217 (-),score=39.16 TRINITY_DN20427_c0_g1_i2:289-939(-)